MRILARHKWVSGATITESIDEKKEGSISYRRFTATIRGFRNWKIFEGYLSENTSQIVRKMVEEIRDKIDNGEEKILEHKGYFIKGRNELCISENYKGSNDFD